MMLGSTPATRPGHQPAERREPALRARSARSASTSAAAPSQMPEALPAVTTPSFLKYGGSLASASGVVSGRMCSSAAQGRVLACLPVLERDRHHLVGEVHRAPRRPRARAWLSAA